MTHRPAIHILIIDDDDSYRTILNDMLSAHGHKVTLAASGAEGLQLARELDPDLIILDVMMPELDGFAVCSQLRADPATAEVPIIMATALDDRQSRLRCLAVGADEFLSKPVDTVELRVRVNAIARINRYRRLLDERARAEREIRQMNTELEQRVAERTAELSEANARLRELNALKDTLMAITSHDLRSPLGGIQNMAEMLLDDQSSAEDVRYFAQQIYETVQRLIAMVNNMLDLSKLEAGKVQLDAIELHISSAVRQAFGVLSSSAQAKEITVAIDAAPDEPLVVGDPHKIGQIATNLMSNAIKFTPSGGQINVHIAAEADGVCMEISDTGLGIPPDALPRLFDKFQQIHPRGTAGERGTGLGLAIVRQLVELHGGNIQVKSVVQNGTTFRVHFPFYQQLAETRVSSFSV